MPSSHVAHVHLYMGCNIQWMADLGMVCILVCFYMLHGSNNVRVLSMVPAL